MQTIVLRTEIVQVEKGQDGQARVLVLFTDDKTVKIQEWINVQSEKETDFKRTLQARVDRIQKTFDFVDKLVTGPYDISSEQSTEDELARSAYLALLMTYNNVQNSVANGLIAADDPNVTQLASDLKAAFKPEYVGIG